MHRLFFYIIFWFSFTLFSQNIRVTQIPDSIYDKADAVVLEEITEINLLGQTKMTEKFHTRILIKNKEGDRFSQVAVFYDPFRKINKLRVNYYDAGGRLLQTAGKNKFKDYAASGRSTLYSDNRVLVYDYTPKSYPYILEIDYSITDKNTAFIPSWHPYPGYNTGVMSSEYYFNYPPGFKLYKIEKNLDKYHIRSYNKPTGVSYFAKTLPPIKKEPMGPAFSQIAPSVKLAVDKFQLAGVKGTAASWEDFGRWMSTELLKGRNKLPEETVRKIKKMTAGVSDPVERAKIIYDYVQKKVHYINVAIGIGGWQPMSAEEVDKLGYGDCKALTNYTKSLLDIAEVPSVYTVVYAGNSQRSIDENLIGVQGNHVFLCIPQAQDSIWLECTSQKIPFGFTDDFTNNRKALAVKESGSKIIRTKRQKDEDNYQLTQAAYSILENGDIEADIDIYSYGNQYTDHLFRYDGINTEELKKRMASYFDRLQNIRFEKIEVKNNKEQKRYEEHIRLKAGHYAQKTADTAMIFAANAFNRISFVPPKLKERKQNLIIKQGYKDEEEYTVNLPEGYQPASLPENKSLENEFGYYKTEYIPVNDRQLKYHRVIFIRSGSYPPEAYKKYRKFRKKIKKLEKQKILITKK